MKRSRSRSRLPLLAAFPLVILLVVVATPILLGNHPVRWESGSVLPKIVRGDAGTSSATGTSAGSTKERTRTSGGAEQATQVTKKWKPGMPQWGVQIYWEENAKHTDDFIERLARKHADYLIGLGANSVAISFPFYTEGKTSTKIMSGAKTPSPQRMARVLTVFREAGLRTTVRPIMDEKSLNPPKGWRGSVAPASRAAWFSSYRTFLMPYLAMAEQQKVSTFAIGAELNSLEGDANWGPLVEAAEKAYGGEVAYDANWDNYAAGRIDMPVKHLGVDAYFPVKVPDTASVDTLVQGWNTWLNKKSTGPLPKIVLAEAGIGAMDGAYHTPGDFYTKRAVNPKVQANWYTAVCRVVEQRRMSGVYWWSIYFEDDPNTPPDDKVASRLDFAGRPLSEKAIRECFTSEYAGPGSTATQ